MGYNNKTDIFVNYFKKAETPKTDFNIGVEVEHFIVDSKSMKAVSYYEENGIEDILKELSNYDWTPVFEKDHIIGLNKESIKITLEPGGQIEISLSPEKNIDKIKKNYQEFLNQIIPILKSKNREILTLGYQPVSLEKDIPLIPKKRYDYMYEYFTDKGKYSHNMMKATASIHVNLDFSDENDYIKKIKVASFLSPLIYYVFDNSPFFEGKPCPDKSVRGMIWDDCDTGRRDLVNMVFSKDFGYREYARYLLSIPPILFLKDDKLEFTGDIVLEELIDPEDITTKEIEYILSMVFPDIRTKKYIEVRMGDVLPYPESLGYIVFWKGLMYSQENLDYIYKQIKEYDEKSFNTLKKEVLNQGYKASILGDDLNTYFMKLFDMAENGLNDNEIGYLNNIRKILEKYRNPKRKILNNLSKDKSSALEWCKLDI